MKAKAAWKDVIVDPKILSATKMTGFLCMKELRNYEIVSGNFKATQGKVCQKDSSNSIIAQKANGLFPLIAIRQLRFLTQNTL